MEKAEVTLHDYLSYVAYYFLLKYSIVFGQTLKPRLSSAICYYSGIKKVI